MLRLIIAAFAGAVIGIERELRGKPAGLRTIVLIAMGSALFMIGSQHIALMTPDDVVNDPARIAAQIVTGVGFLGAGAIIVSRKGVIGLTTAAIIWITAAVGMVIGYGQLLLGSLAAVLVLLTHITLTLIEIHWLHPWARNHGFNNVDGYPSMHAKEEAEKEKN
jgi:putative Mg2+ transporter-C (MgtC) family protein